jgi:hypothetical protein
MIDQRLQRVMIERLMKSTALFHRRNRHRDIAVAGDEDEG